MFCNFHLSLSLSLFCSTCSLVCLNHAPDGLTLFIYIEQTYLRSLVRDMQPINETRRRKFRREEDGASPLLRHSHASELDTSCMLLLYCFLYISGLIRLTSAWAIPSPLRSSHSLLVFPFSFSCLWRKASFLCVVIIKMKAMLRLMIMTISKWMWPGLILLAK